MSDWPEPSETDPNLALSPETPAQKYSIPKSKRSDWVTPRYFYEALNEVFGFTVDVCASDDNFRHPRYFTESQNGLVQSWRSPDGSPGVAWCNPPYGAPISEWVPVAAGKARLGEATTVMLVPARTDVGWYHDYVLEKENCTVAFVRGRITFEGAPHPAPFPCLVIVFHASVPGTPARPFRAMSLDIPAPRKPRAPRARKIKVAAPPPSADNNAESIQEH